VTVNAVAGDRVPHFCKDPALFNFVAAQAALRKGRQIALGFVNVMASGAGHIRRRLKATAFLQQNDLLAVNVNVGVRVNRTQINVFLQRLSGNKRERRS
jgi:hypothetical protein